MEQYRFVGVRAEIDAERVLERFGESISLDPAEAAALIAQNVPILPEEVWQQAGITRQECADFFSTELHQNAPASFLAKRDQIWKLLHEYKSAPFTSTSPAKGE